MWREKEKLLTERIQSQERAFMLCPRNVFPRNIDYGKQERKQQR
jgi:hypothetical protein